MKKAHLSVRAHEDLRSHVAYLDSQRHGYGRRFLLAFQKTLRYIERSAESIALYGFEAPGIDDVRVSTVTQFEQWLVLFRVADEEIQILRVLHGSRHIDHLGGEILPE